MRFKVDENLPVEVALALRDAGHEADTVVDEGRSGAPDAEISRLIQHEQRALVTLDVDFSNLRRYPPSEYHGLVVLRLHIQSKPSCLSAIQRVLDRFNREDLVGRLWTVGETTIRTHE